MRYYLYVPTGKRYSGTELKEYFDIYSKVFSGYTFDEAVNELINIGLIQVEMIDHSEGQWIIECHEPSVIAYLDRGYKVHAMKRYRDIHGCSLRKAMHMVELIEKDIAAIRKGEKRPWQV